MVGVVNNSGSHMSNFMQTKQNNQDEINSLNFYENIPIQEYDEFNWEYICYINNGKYEIIFYKRGCLCKCDCFRNINGVPVCQ
jgi:hypothetical protein